MMRFLLNKVAVIALENKECNIIIIIIIIIMLSPYSTVVYVDG